MPDKIERTKPHDPAKQKAAKDRVFKGWWDKPEHKPTKADDERTRDDALDDPSKQEGEPG